MLLIDDNNKTIILDSIHTPIKTDYMWVLDLNMMDFSLTPLLILEEVVAPSIEITINGFRFVLPANWNMLVADDDTTQLDVVEVSELAGRDFRTMVYGPSMPRPITLPVTVVDYHPNFKNVGPSLNKHQMLCHPISPEWWINVSPSDAFNKYLKGMSVGDII